MLHSGYLSFPALGLLAACRLWGDQLPGAVFPGAHQNFSSLWFTHLDLLPMKEEAMAYAWTCMYTNPSYWRVHI